MHSKCWIWFCLIYRKSIGVRCMLEQTSTFCRHSASIGSVWVVKVVIISSFVLYVFPSTLLPTGRYNIKLRWLLFFEFWEFKSVYLGRSRNWTHTALPLFIWFNLSISIERYSSVPIINVLLPWIQNRSIMFCSPLTSEASLVVSS